MTTKIPVSETGFCKETCSRCRKNLCCVSAKVVPNHLLHLCYDHFEFVLQRKHSVISKLSETSFCVCGWFGEARHFSDHLKHPHKDDDLHPEECLLCRGFMK